MRSFDNATDMPFQSALYELCRYDMIVFLTLAQIKLEFWLQFAHWFLASTASAIHQAALVSRIHPAKRSQDRFNCLISGLEREAESRHD